MVDSTIKTIRASEYLKEWGLPLKRLNNEVKIREFIDNLLDSATELTAKVSRGYVLELKTKQVETSEEAIHILRRGGRLQADGGKVLYYKKDNAGNLNEGLYMQYNKEETYIDVTA